MSAFGRRSSGFRKQSSLARAVVLAVLATALFVVFYVRQGRLAPPPESPPKTPTLLAEDQGATNRAVTSQTTRTRTRATGKRKQSATTQPAPDDLVATNAYRDSLDLALEETDPIDRSMAFGRLFSEWFARDPDAALVYLSGLPPSPEYTSGLLLALTSVGKNDPSRAIELAQQLATNEEQQVVYSVLFDTFARASLSDAEQLLAEAPPGAPFESAIRALASRWTDSNLESALAWAQKLKEEDGRSSAIETVLFSLAPQDPWRALDIAAHDLDGEPLERTVARVMQRLGELDPEQAGRILQLLPEGQTQTHIALDLARALASSNPAVAVAWTSKLPDVETREMAVKNVLDVWVGTSPNDAKSYVAKLPSGASQDSAAEHLAVRLAAMDPLDAARWANTLPTESARREALIGVATGWAQQDASAAAQWAAQLPAADAARNEAIYSAVSYWVLSDADAASAFAKSIKPAAARKAAIRALNPHEDSE
ncbi:MAG: hypothetical protein M5U15_12815 [Kiritimatiellae bacterium]|nr:hypothetical protein [Kiritimatiellia bacterium]